MELDALVRRVDEDRWLASRFASAGQQRRLIALYALNYEIARIAEGVREAALGDIRYAWWGEALALQKSGAHPTLDAFLELWPERAACETMRQIADVRRAADLSPTPFADLDAMEAYATATAGSLIRLAGGCFGGIEDALADSAGRAWAMAGLLRAAPYWMPRGRKLIPLNADAGAVLKRIEAAYAQARALAPRAPASAFAAFGYVSLTPAYRHAPERPPSLFARQIRLVIAAARGRL
jgi:phytoene synthase